MPDIFSVITINYNNLTGLKKTLQSVFEQSRFNNLELIVVDGGSTDGSAEYLKENAERIGKLIIEKDSGIYDAMNKGMALATGKYVWFVNSGDFIFSSKIIEELLPLTQKDPDVIFGDTMFVEPNGRELGPISKLKPQTLPNHLVPSSFRYGMSVCHQSFIVKKTLCPDYDMKYRQAADIDWIIRILEKNPITAKYEGIISAFEVGGSSYQNERKAWKERYSVLKKHYGTVPNFMAHIWILIRRALFKWGIWKP